MTPIEVLAEYLTGTNTGGYSIGITMPKTTPHYKQAERYFELRKAFGIEGYASKSEAHAKLCNVITEWFCDKD